MRSVGALVCALAMASAVPPNEAGPSQAEVRSANAEVGPSAATPEVGSIAGEVTLNIRPPRRSARRYSGRPEQARTAQAIPAVVFLRGSVPGAPFRPGGAPDMAQQDTAFMPSVLYVPRGGTVSFPNDDPFFHNVFSYSGTKRFDLGRFPQGESREVVFDQTGIVSVFCEVHDFMRAAIIVSDNPFYGMVEEDGSFRIDDIPPGEYTLVVWHVDLGEVEEAVTVPDGGTAQVSLELG